MDSTTTEVVIEFGAAVQTLEALQAAAYRSIGTATCQIDQTVSGWACRLSPVQSSLKRTPQDLDSLKSQFLDLVTDENLRERIAKRTEPLRNVILSLAFGALVNSKSGG
jgi:His-Xaa-Ser system protein HxsD